MNLVDVERMETLEARRDSLLGVLSDQSPDFNRNAKASTALFLIGGGTLAGSVYYSKKRKRRNQSH